MVTGKLQKETSQKKIGCSSPVELTQGEYEVRVLFGFWFGQQQPCCALFSSLDFIYFKLDTFLTFLPILLFEQYRRKVLNIKSQKKNDHHFFCFVAWVYREAKEGSAKIVTSLFFFHNSTLWFFFWLGEKKFKSEFGFSSQFWISFLMEFEFLSSQGYLVIWKIKYINQKKNRPTFSSSCVLYFHSRRCTHHIPSSLW